MALYAIGDTHLSLGSSDKPMDVFGGAWTGYVEKLTAGFARVQPEDTVVLCGDLSWGMSLEEAEADFAYLDRLPGGRKLLVKGNHDYWWTTAAKMERFFSEHGFTTLQAHNNCAFYGPVALCGTRGWMLAEHAPDQEQKVMNRELMRLEASLKAAGDTPKLCFLHYPPAYQGYRCAPFLELMARYGVTDCYYGHLHGAGRKLAAPVDAESVRLHLISADQLDFQPQKIWD